MLKNTVTLIFGSSGKIGSKVSESILDNQGIVYLTDIKKANLTNLKKFDKNNFFFEKANIINELEINNLFKSCIKKYGKIDAVINCAYPKSKKWGSKIENLEAKYLKEDLFNQLGLSIILSKIAIKFFRKQSYGNLILLSSIQGITNPKFDHYIGTNMNSPIEYSAIKAGIISITRYLAKYCKKENIRVNCISPGGIINQQPTKFLKKYNENCSSKGMLDATDLTGTFLFLLSNHSKFVTGQNMIIDDGWSL